MTTSAPGTGAPSSDTALPDTSKLPPGATNSGTLSVSSLVGGRGSDRTKGTESANVPAPREQGPPSVQTWSDTESWPKPNSVAMSCVSCRANEKDPKVASSGRDDGLSWRQGAESLQMSSTAETPPLSMASAAPAKPKRCSVCPEQQSVRVSYKQLDCPASKPQRARPRTHAP